MKAKQYTMTVSPGDPGFITKKVNRSKDAEEYARQFYFDDMEIYESVFIMLLNRANKITGWVKISQGGTSGTVVDPKLIAKYAIDSLAANVILCHNHPSGQLIPSEADKAITMKVRDGLKLFDIILLDHILLTADGFLSFSDDGIM